MMTQIMGHPPGGEADPDDRAMHLPADGYEEDADGNVVPTGAPVEAQPQPPPDGAGWSQEQLQVLLLRVPEPSRVWGTRCC